MTTTFDYFEKAMEHDCRRTTAEDLEEFNAIKALLPAPQPGDCGFCGPHSYTSMRLALQLVRPRKILEIGFNLGHSSMFWLRNSQGAEVVSIDVKVDDRVKQAAQKCAESGRFMFFERHNFLVDSQHLLFDLAFIDGSHDFDSVLTDIELCKALKIPYLLLDDWLTLYGDAQRAVLASGLKIIFISGNQALVTTDAKFSHYYAA